MTEHSINVLTYAVSILLLSVLFGNGFYLAYKSRKEMGWGFSAALSFIWLMLLLIVAPWMYRVGKHWL